MALNFFRVVDGETELAEENGLGYQMVHGRMNLEKLTEMILFCDGVVLDTIVKTLTMGVQLRTENWLKRLSELEKELFRDVWADVTYKDGTRKRVKMLDVLSLYTNGGTPPQIVDVSFIGDTSNQGILPDLVKYLIENNQ
jgi:hypothetical protein